MKRTVHSIDKTFRQVVSCLLALALFLPGLFALTSCDNNLGLDPEDAAKVLTIQITVPGGVPATKAAPGDVSSIDPESMIYNIQVWMFNHQAPDATAADDETAVSYSEMNIAGGWANTQNRQSGYYDQWTNTTTYEVPVYLSSAIMARDTSNLKFDFYILANGSSVGNTLSSTSKRADLKAATFGQTGDPFGPTAPKTGNTPLLAINNGSSDGPGLPISGFFNRPRNDDGSTSATAAGVNLKFLKERPNISNDEMKKYIPVVQITRAVSKLRFVFAKTTGMSGVSITRIEVDGGVIPAQTYLFPRENGTEFALPASTSYVSSVTSVGSLTSDDILGVDDPLLLRSDSEQNASKTAQEYENYLNTTIGTKTSTQKFAYLRESDKPVSCKIYYKLTATGEEKVAEFSMSDVAGYSADITNFHRNHNWTVYAYFLGSGLYIKPVVMDWEDGSSYQYLQYGSAVVAISDKKEILFSYGWTTSNSNSWWQAHMNDNPAAVTEWYFRRQDEGYTSEDGWNYDWLHSQMISAPGLNVAGAPIYANRIELRTNGFVVPLRLKLSNTDDFYLVTYNATSSEYVSWDSADGAEIPLTVSAGGTTYFYVVPKDGSTHEEKTTKAYLVTSPSDGSGSQKLPFNAGVFPGSNENTEIFFYSVSVNDFKSYYNAADRPYNIKPYDQSREVTI